MSYQLEKLFEPVTIGMMEVKNRIVMCPMGGAYPDVTGAVNERTIDYYTERAIGGVGLIIVEGSIVESLLGNLGPYPRILIDDDKFIAGLSDLVESVHNYETKIAIQLQHPGVWSTSAGKTPVSASAISGLSGIKARALTVEEIKDLEMAFAKAALRAKLAGFDAITINGGVGLLITQFLSPLTNKRTDRYGGDLDGRMRFILEITELVQQKVGEDYPIIFDHPADEFVEGGIRLEESKVIAQRLEKAGVAAFRMHSGIHDPRFMHWLIPPPSIPSGFQVRYAEETRKALNIAKVLVGRKLDDLFYANQILQEDKADLIVLGRALLADPELPKKAANGRLDEIRKCIHCNQCVFRTAEQYKPLACAVNAATGREKEFQIIAAKKQKKVLVVGGGPSGMEAARVAALRGHNVTLYEANSKLGGQLNLACVAPYKEEIRSLIAFLASQLEKLGVRIEPGREVTKEIVEKENPEVVILATGAKALVPKIPGIERGNVSLAWDVLANKAKIGNSAIVVGAGYVGCEVAEYLAKKGKTVTIIEQLPDIANELEQITRRLLLDRLDEYGVTILTNTRVEEITDKKIVAINKNWEKRTIETETVVLAIGSVPYRPLAELNMKGMAEIYSVGDCRIPRNILSSIYEGSWVARQI
ncbi:FAD-dependent oxidoreductase [Chloroflexota bacterium]